MAEKNFHAQFSVIENFGLSVEGQNVTRVTVTRVTGPTGFWPTDKIPMRKVGNIIPRN